MSTHVQTCVCPNNISLLFCSGVRPFVCVSNPFYKLVVTTHKFLILLLFKCTSLKSGKYCIEYPSNRISITSQTPWVQEVQIRRARDSDIIDESQAVRKHTKASLGSPLDPGLNAYLHFLSHWSRLIIRELPRWTISVFLVLPVCNEESRGSFTSANRDGLIKFWESQSLDCFLMLHGRVVIEPSINSTT